jgi:hypothetical protein
LPKIALTKVNGILSAPKRLGAGEAGFFLNCRNFTVSPSGVLQTRNGFASVSSTAAQSYDRIFYDHINDKVFRASTSTNLLDELVGTTSLDTSNKYCAHGVARGLSFFLSSAGYRRTNVAISATENANIPEGLDINSTGLTGSTGCLPAASQVAYRIVFGIKLSNKEFFLGAPSGRTVVTNSTAASADVTIRFSLPAEITTSYFYQVYKTQPSAGASVDPGDEMFLIYEDYPTAGDIVNKYVEFTDRVPDGNGGASLYTNESQQGILQANYPNECSMGTNREGAMANFANCIFTSSYRPRSNITINLLSVLTTTGLNARTIVVDTTNGSPTLASVSALEFTGLAVGMRLEGTGITAGTTILTLNTGAGTITMSANATATNAGVSVVASDIITIGGTEYYAHTSETIADREFLVSTDASAAKAVRLTAESLVRVINRNTTNTNTYAIYQSGSNDLPGRIYIFARSLRDNTLTIQASSHGTAFSPNITTAQTIESKEDQTTIQYSKPNEPQAFPPLNFLKLPENAVVTGLSSLRAALIIWTTKGLYRVVGTYGNFLLELIDDSVYTIQPATSAARPALPTVCNNIAFCRTSKGLVAATESGVQIVSTPVANHLNVSSSLERPVFSDEVGGVVFVPISGGTLLYHLDSNAWTIYDVELRHGILRRSNFKIYTTTAEQSYTQDSGGVASNLTYDATNAVTINSIDTGALTITLASAPAGTKAGDVLVQGLITATVKSVNSNTLTLTSVTGFATGAATHYSAVIAYILYCMVGSPDPTTTKQFRYANAVFDGDTIASGLSSGNIAFLATSNVYMQAPVKVDVGYFTDQYSSASAGTTEYVTPNAYSYLSRHFVPQNYQRASITLPHVTITTVSPVRYSGLELDYEGVSDKTRRGA